MDSNHDKTRRAVIASLSALPALASAAEDRAAQGRRNSRILVAYFSRSGNTRVIAGLLQRSLGADLVEIERATPYPADYLETVAEATRERDNGTEPALKPMGFDKASFDTVYLGFPIWGETAPPVIRSFLGRRDFTGKTLVPFITHGGFGPGRSISALESHAPSAILKDAFVMEADQERRTMNTVLGWLGKQAKS